MPEATPPPAEIAAALGRRLVGQGRAIQEMSIVLAKKLAGLPAGNVLLIGSSGTGKTTLMRAVEEYLGSRPELGARATQVRVHANLLAEEAERRRPGEALLARLVERAREELGEGAAVEPVLERARRGIVFVDEIDKIRSRIDDRPHLAGIRAQEALLTLIENEAVPFALPDWMGGGVVRIDAGELLFVGAGAFEGLYDAVYDRVTLGRDRGALKSTTFVDGGAVREETVFRLADWLRSQDLFDYGMSPQFLSRFDSVVLLEDLGEDALVEIFLTSPESGYRQSKAWFEHLELELAVSPAAVRRIAAEAAREPRLGARALQGVFRRVMRGYELDPHGSAVDGTLVIDLPEVERALGERTG